jgi:hypothetical protein
MRKIVLISALFFSVTFFVYGQTTEQTEVQRRRAELQAQLDLYEQQIAQTQKLVSQKQQEAQTLQRDVYILDGNIKLKKLAIQLRTVTIKQLSEDIGDKSQNISELNQEIQYTKSSLASAIRSIAEHDNTSALELAFAYRSLNDFFNEQESLKDLQNSIHVSFTKFQNLKSQEIQARAVLEDKESEEEKLRELQRIEQKNLEKDEKEKQAILKATRGKESEYRKLLAARQKDAAAIRSALFLLEGSPAISFEKAIAYANTASKATGIRPAFILGILAQESELGKNIGQCNLPDDLPEYKWRAVMKPGRDDEPFLAITRELGLDPEKMPVSCPLRDRNKKRIGWGGAMGPSQFIPSTWVLYKDRIADLTGHRPPNPWDAGDAFMATALLLKDNGGVGDREDEKIAAAKYYAGGNWKSTLGRSYGNQVLAKTDKYQDQITLLQSVAVR